MVKAFVGLLHKEWSGVHQAALLLAAASLSAQFLGLLRDRLLASTFGAGIELDIYYAAFRLPDFVYISLISLISTSVIIPFIINKEKDGGRSSVVYLLNNLVTVFCFLVVLVSLVFFIFLPYLVKFIAPGFDIEAQSELVNLSRIILLSPIILGISNMIGGVSQAYKRFFAYTISPLLYNLGIILGILFIYPKLGLNGLAWGVVLGAVFHLLIQLPTIYKLQIIPSLVIKINWPEVLRVMKTSVPRTITLATSQITSIVLIAYASLLGSGSVAIFTLAHNLQSVPLAIIGISYSVAAFPVLSELFSQGKKDLFLAKINLAFRHIILWSVPAVVFFIVLRAHIVRIVLGGGSFSWSDTRLTAAAMALFIISVVAQSATQLFVRGYYASANTKKPLVINIISSVFTIISAFILVYIFSNNFYFQSVLSSILRVDDLDNLEILMLPLAVSLGAIVNVSLFVFFLIRDFNFSILSSLQALSSSLSASFFGGLLTYLILNISVDWFDQNTFLGIFGHGFLAGLIGVLVWALLLTLFGNREWLEFTRSVIKRFSVKSLVFAEPEEL